MTNDVPAGTGNPKQKNRSGSSKRQRNQQFVVRCTRDEFNKIAASARQTGLKGAAYLRAQGLGDPGERAQRTPPVEKEILTWYQAQLGRLNNNCNQIAKRGNSGFPVDLRELRQVLQDYTPLRDAIFKALGREPAPETKDWDEFTSVGRKALEASPGTPNVTIPADLLRRMIGNPPLTTAPEPPIE